MTEQKLEIMEFPCEFTLKVIGNDELGFVELVMSIVNVHVEGVAAEHISTRPSKGGKYTAVSVRLNAKSREQMNTLYQELHAHEKVVMVL